DIELDNQYDLCPTHSDYGAHQYDRNAQSNGRKNLVYTTNIHYSGDVYYHYWSPYRKCIRTWIGNASKIFWIRKTRSRKLLRFGSSGTPRSYDDHHSKYCNFGNMCGGYAYSVFCSRTNTTY